MLPLQILLLLFIFKFVVSKVIDSSDQSFNVNNNIDQEKIIKDEVDSLSELAGLNTLAKLEISQFRDTLHELKVDITEVSLENIEDAKCNHFDSSGNAFTERTFN